MLECNYLTILLKPNYEKPVDTAEDIIERGMQIINSVGRESIIEMLKKSPYPLTRKLAESTIVPKVVICLFYQSFNLMIVLGRAL